MNVLLIIFIISLGIIIAMFSHRALEIKRGGFGFYKQARAKTDYWTVIIQYRLKKISSIINKKHFIQILKYLVFHFVRFIFFIREVIIGVERLFFEALKRRAILQKKGSVSFFLKNISEYKKKRWNEKHKVMSSSDSTVEEKKNFKV